MQGDSGQVMGNRWDGAGLVLGQAWTTPPAAQNYVGAEHCGSCHGFEYRGWAQSPHARAQLSVTPEQLKNIRCSSCHSLPEEPEKVFLGVQCERCHGSGRHYQVSYVMQDAELARAVGLIDPQPSHCQQCHTEGAPSVKPFEYASMWGQIAHPRVARPAWEQRHAGASAAPPAAPMTATPRAP